MSSGDIELSGGTSSKTTVAGEGTEGSIARESLYLMVFEGDSCSVFELPDSGTVVVGRQESCELRLQDLQISRTHCRIITLEGRAMISDLGSQNGTFVNGERITGVRHLVTGDVIALFDTHLVFHSRTRVDDRRDILEFEAFCSLTAEDIDRAERLRHGFALATVALAKRADPARLLRILVKSTRRIDRIGKGTGEQVMVAMPEIDDRTAQQGVLRILAALKAEDAALDPRAGLAISPADGSDLNTLIANARAACSAASPGGIGRVSAVEEVLQIGERKIVVADPAMKRLYALLERLAKADLPVLIHGETGTGKELASQALHLWSQRQSGPFVAINCAALPEGLAESALFGHVKGAFSGATDHRIGFLESGSGGTVFLDEIGELPPPIQAKLLRALETKRIVRIGDVTERACDIRVVAATNRDLKREVKEGRFRQDLFFRLSGGTIWLPPLRDRPQELPMMARAFLEEACVRSGREPMRISDGGLRALRSYDWPGNVRELKNVLEYVAAAHPDEVLEPHHLAERLQGGAREEEHPTAPQPPPDPPMFRPIDEEVRELEKERMRQALIYAGGNQKKAAELISMPLRTFVTKLKVYDLKSSLGLGARETHHGRAD